MTASPVARQRRTRLNLLESLRESLGVHLSVALELRNEATMTQCRVKDSEHREIQRGREREEKSAAAAVAATARVEGNLANVAPSLPIHARTHPAKPLLYPKAVHVYTRIIHMTVSVRICTYT